MPNPKWIIALLSLSALPVMADTAGPMTVGPLKLAELSARLYDAGVESGDPVMIATAARLRKSAGLTALAALDWDAMLTMAETLAKDDADILGVIGDIRVEGTKGVASGPITHLAALAAGGSETRPAMPFRAGEYAEAYVEAPLGLDLNLTVLDADGRIVCSDLNPSHIAYCGWTPATDGAFTLVIQNASDQMADYALMTN